MSRLRPLTWPREVALGFWRSAVLVGLTGAIPAVCALVAVIGFPFTTSWSKGIDAPLGVVLIAAAGEWALATWWVLVALWGALLLFSRPLSEATRAVVGRWTGTSFAVRYRSRVPVTRMATGFWWNGYEYHKTRRSARIRGWLLSRRHDPTAWRNFRWTLLAAVTVLPVAAIPLLAAGSALYVAMTGGFPALAAALAAGAVVTAPFGWRIVQPLGPRFLGPPRQTAAEARVDELETMQADLTQAQAAELERIERALHDGAQARLVALGLSLGAAERLVETDPDGARAILREARASSAAALAELRLLVRGINPPVLTERGLVDAIRALALDAPLDVTVRGTLPGRPERPIESALYFAVAELLANTAKHARGTRATVELGAASGQLTVVVTDDGVGGAAPSEGSGLRGIERRLAVFRGGLEIESPAGGPTRITVRVPCASS